VFVLLLILCHHRGMTTQNTTPVELAIELFGGVRKLARMIDRDPAAVSRWRKAGAVPTSVQRRMLEVAWERGIDLTAHDIIFGRTHD
jgi:hypothetical protein